jgi:hypothetical protein
MIIVVAFLTAAVWVPIGTVVRDARSTANIPAADITKLVRRPRKSIGSDSENCCYFQNLFVGELTFLDQITIMPADAALLYDLAIYPDLNEPQLVTKIVHNPSVYSSENVRSQLGASYKFIPVAEAADKRRRVSRAQFRPFLICISNAISRDGLHHSSSSLCE